MKVLLIEPNKAKKSIGGEDYHVFEPLALEYLAAGIKTDHDVKILDLRIRNDFESVLNRFNPDVVGITGYSVHVNVMKQYCEKIKQYDSRTFTIVGGHHATVMPADFHSPHIDCVVMGEGVFTLKHILEKLDRGEKPDGIPGTAIPNQNSLKQYPDGVMGDLDAFPFPARELTREYRKYYFTDWMRPLASIRTSKGCRFKCNFCALWKLTDGKYLTRKPESIVEELAGIEEEYVFFADDESLLDVDRMKRLATLLKQAGIRKKYFLYGRSDTIVKNRDLLELWKDIGLERIFVGLEFFRDEDLKYIRKGSSVDHNTQAIQLLKSIGIDIHPQFIVRPEFDVEDFSLFKEYCLQNDFEFIGFSVLTPLPGTDLFETLKDQLITDDYELFDFIHTVLPTTLPMKEFYREYMELLTNTRSISNQYAFIKKFPLKHIPSLFRSYFKIRKQLLNIQEDY